MAIKMQFWVFRHTATIGDDADKDKDNGDFSASDSGQSHSSSRLGDSSDVEMLSNNKVISYKKLFTMICKGALMAALGCLPSYFTAYFSYFPLSHRLLLT
jgi:hypothetical protein